VDLVEGSGTFWLGGEAGKGEREGRRGESRIRWKGKGSPWELPLMLLGLVFVFGHSTPYL